MTCRVAVIGLGQMGASMASRLAETDVDVIGFDIMPAARERAAAAGIAVASGIAEAVAGREAIFTSLPDSAAVTQAWLGDGGVVAAAPPGTLCIELSTIDPATMRTVALAATERGLRVVDCPVSGSPKEAREGKLVMLAGGEREVVEAAGPLLLKLGASWVYSGPAGTAKVVKIVNNMMSMGNVLVAAEAFAVGVAAGVESGTLFDILSVSGGRSHHFIKRFPNALKGDFSPGFKMELGEKDLGLAIELARNAKVPAPAAALVRELSNIALAEGFRGQDIVALLAMYQRWSTGK